MFLTWQRHFSALWGCMKNRSPLKSSGDKCQLLSEKKKSGRVNNCISSWGDCLALCSVIGIEWLEIILMSHPFGELTDFLGSAWIKATVCLFLRIQTFQRTVLETLLMCRLYVHLPSNSYIALGILWLAENPKANPLFYTLIVWVYRNHLWFWQRCKQMLGFNCVLSFLCSTPFSM